MTTNVSSGFISSQQARIIRLGWNRVSYSHIRRSLGLCNEEAVARCLVRTVLGFFWASLCPGGRISYLCDLDVERFREIACDRARSINCITKAEAREIAYDLREKRREFGIGYLMALDCDGLTGRLNAIYTTQFPDDNIIRSICERAELNICRPQTLELARRQHWNYDRVQAFLMRYEELFQRDRRLIWNADESQLNSTKRFKVICDQGHLPLVTAFEHVPHLTGMVSISGGGVVLAPIIILKKLQYLRELANYDTHCFFATSTNGWMTKNLWVYYSLIFSAQISHYRLSLPLALRDEDILLIIDGHKTRLSLLAALIFEMNGIDVLVLPPYSSHLLQMFDVGPASPIKTALKEKLDKRMSGISTARPGEKMQRIRIALIESFINALHRGATPGNIISGFSRTGICPFNPDVVLRSDFAVEAPNASIFHTVNTGTEINEIVLTWEEGLNKLSQIEFRRNLTEADRHINYRQVWENLLRKTIAEGWPLSPPPSMFVQKNATTIGEVDITKLPF